VSSAIVGCQAEGLPLAAAGQNSQVGTHWSGTTSGTQKS
jgi:hypothetical protein